MFTISPIGSCRITTPLKNGQDRHGFKLNLSRCYGYCHSPAEAIQLARFMRGEVDIPTDIWPLISRSHDLDAISAQRHDMSHLYVVELASAKELTIDGVSVQLNYLRLAFQDFFSDPVRMQGFWGHAQAGDPDAISDFLAREWSATESQKAEASMLRRIRLNLVNRESLRGDIQTLATLLPEVLFVSHVDARKPDGSTIASRSQFISLVAEVTRELGYRFYDPTDLMHETGQSVAIEDESTGLAHFTPRFGDMLMDEWAHHAVAPVTDRFASEDDSNVHEALVRPQVQAALRHGRHGHLRSRILALPSHEMTTQRLLSQVSEALATKRGEFRDRVGQLDIERLAPVEIAEMAETAGKLGLFSLALDIVTRSVDGFRTLSAHLLVQLAHRASEALEYDDAFEFALAAYTRNPELRRARAVLIQIAFDARINLLAALTADQSVAIFSGLTAREKLGLLELNDMSPSEAITLSWTASDILDMASCLSEDGDFDAASKLLRAWRTLHEQDRIRESGLADLIAEWVEHVRALEDAAERIRTLVSLTEACPHHREVRLSFRQMRSDLVDRIRAAGKAGDLENLEAMKTEVDALPMPLPEYDLWRARVRFDRGDYGDVLALGPIAADHLSERIGVWVLLMRAALRADEDSKATEFAGRVVDLACDRTEKLRAEAEAVLTGQLVGS